MKRNKIFHNLLKVVLSLILITPIFGALGFFPEPTRDLYSTDSAFNFIQVIMNDANYINYIMALVFSISIFLLWFKREAFAAILIAPITVNIVAFHWFVDGGVFTSGAVMGNILLILNVYLIWKNNKKYKILLDKN